MLKLMIAEDEIIERKSLQHIVNKFYSSRIEIVYETATGSDMLEKALQLRPDIILMDIHMPEMDGLEASALIKRHLPNTEILILTAFSYFEYAKRAIHIGVSDYLVKPYSNSKFCEAVDQMIEKIDKRKEQFDEHKRMKGQLENLGIVFQKEIILEMIHGENITMGQLQQYKDYLDIKSNTFMCIIIRTDARNNLNDGIIGTIRNKFRFVASRVVAYAFLKDIVLLLFEDGLIRGTKYVELKNAIKDVQQYLENSFQISSCVGTSNIQEGLLDIHQAYIEARQSIQQKNSDMVQTQTEKPGSFNFQYPYDREAALCEKILNEDYKASVEQLSDIIKYIKKFAGDNRFFIYREYFKQLYALINRNMNQFFGGNFHFKDIEDATVEIEKIGDVEGIQFYMENTISDIIFGITQHKRDRNQKMVELVKKFVEINIHKDVSLKQVADYIGLSTFYFSKIFKKAEGINFKEYVIKIKMEKAKCLMRKEGKTVGEAAREVGYSDPNYFSKAFKNYAGIAPKKFCNR